MRHRQVGYYYNNHMSRRVGSSVPRRRLVDVKSFLRLLPSEQISVWPGLPEKSSPVSDSQGLLLVGTFDPTLNTNLRKFRPSVN